MPKRKRPEPLYQRAENLRNAIITFKEEGVNDIEDAQRSLEDLLEITRKRR